jgi:hypothetical protein
MFRVTRKPKSRWAMPVSLQSRAPLVCAVVEASRKRRVPQSPLGFHIRPRRMYQVQILSQGSDHEPDRITLATPSSLRCVPAEENVTTMDGRAARWLSFEPTHDEAWPWYLRSLFSRVETVTVRHEYSDGRDDYEQCLLLVISPTRTWVLWSLLSVAVLYFVSAVTHHLIKLDPEWPELIAYVQNLARRPALWLGLSGLVIIPWLFITLLDRIKLGYGWRCRQFEK